MVAANDDDIVIGFGLFVTRGYHPEKDGKASQTSHGFSHQIPPPRIPLSGRFVHGQSTCGRESIEFDSEGGPKNDSSYVGRQAPRTQKTSE